MTHPAVRGTFIAISLGFALHAWAQGDDRHDTDRRAPAQRAAEPNGQAPEAQRHGDSARRDGQRDQRGAGPAHAYHTGQRLPPAYRGNEYVVDDWRGHHLQAPPRGYHWVQTGADYLLVAITT